jgi:hypothetical protein
MKILLPFQDPYNRKLSCKTVSGGIERFCKAIKENYKTVVHEVSYESTKEWTVLEKHETSEEIIQRAEDCSADIIISNFTQTIFSGKEIIKSPIPILLIEHCLYPMMATAIGRWTEAIDNGHSLYFVSEFQREKYNKVSRRNGQRILPDNFINPAYAIERPDPMDIKYEVGTIGRCDSGKDPFRVKRMTKGTDISSLVITSKTPFSKDLKYYNKNNYASVDGGIDLEDGTGELMQDAWDNVLWNEPYDVVMKNIAKCGTYYSTWPNETWGITSLEALSCGVPIILNCEKSHTLSDIPLPGFHASENIPAHPSHYVKIRNNDKGDLIKAIKSFENIDRKEVQEMTLAEHGLETWKSNLEVIMEKTIDQFKKCRRNLTSP